MASPHYALRDGLFYIDAAGAQAYAATEAETEIVIRQAVDVAPTHALAAWYKFIWFTASAEEVCAGKGPGHVGHTRFTAELAIEEKILAAGLPSEGDPSGAVGGVIYDVTKSMKFPIETKLTFVRFLPVESGKTEIVWTVKLTAAGEAETSTLAQLVQTRVAGGLKMFAEAVNSAARVKL